MGWFRRVLGFEALDDMSDLKTRVTRLEGGMETIESALRRIAEK